MEIHFFLVIAIVLISSLWLFSKSLEVAHPLLLILGPSGSGKTALFFKLKNDILRETVPSLKMNQGLVNYKNKSIEAIDYPGHESLRPGLLPLIPKSSRILFLVDPSDKIQIKKGAEFLFSLLSLPSLKSPITLIFTKDGKMNTGISEIDKEIEKMRKITEENSRFLGVDGIAFSLRRDSPVAIDFESVSLKK
jgi:GTPase SAR1 family protein